MVVPKVIIGQNDSVGISQSRENGKRNWWKDFFINLLKHYDAQSS